MLIGYRVKSETAALLRAAGLNAAAPVVLMYHSILDEPSLPWLAVPPAEFKAQLAGLRQRGFSFIGMDEVVAAVKGERSLAAQSICVTFDDGRRDNLLHALPVLEELAVPATIFIATRPCEAGDRMRGVALCSPDEVGLLGSHPLITVAGHGHRHVRLADLPRDEAVEDVETGKRRLEAWLGHPVAHFAYPYGSFSDDTVTIVRNAGYVSAATVRPGHLGGDRSAYRIGRLAVARGTSPRALAGMCSAGYVAMSSLRS